MITAQQAADQAAELKHIRQELAYIARALSPWIEMAEMCQRYGVCSKTLLAMEAELRAALAAQPVEPTMDTVLRNAARRAGTVVARGRLVQPAEPVADLNPMYRQMWQEQVSLNQQLCAALAAPPAPAAVPPGMALVPIEPTQEMIAAIPFPSNVTPNIAVAAYRAMIAAAGEKT